MARAAEVLAVVAVLGLLASAQAGLTIEECVVQTQSVADPSAYASNILACALVEGTTVECCAKVNSIYGVGGMLDSCFCHEQYAQVLVAALGSTGIDQDSYMAEMQVCGVPVPGDEICFG